MLYAAKHIPNSTERHTCMQFLTMGEEASLFCTPMISRVPSTEVGRAILNKYFFGVLGPRMHVWLCKDALT